MSRLGERGTHGVDVVLGQAVVDLDVEVLVARGDVAVVDGLGEPPGASTLLARQIAQPVGEDFRLVLQHEIFELVDGVERTQEIRVATVDGDLELLLERRDQLVLVELAGEDGAGHLTQLRRGRLDPPELPGDDGRERGGRVGGLSHGHCALLGY